MDLLIETKIKRINPRLKQSAYEDSRDYPVSSLFEQK